MYLNKKLLTIGLSLLMSVGIFAQNNLVQNGGFENGIDQIWELIGGGGSDANYSLNTTEAVEGVNCLQAEVITLGSNSWDVQIKNGFGPVEEGKVYRTSIWAKAATDGSTVNYTIGKATAGYDEYAASYGLELTTDWVEYTHEFVAQVSTTDDITLAMHITGVDTYWFDDFSVFEVTDEVSSAIIAKSGKSIEVAFITNLKIPSAEDQLPFFVYSETTNYLVSEVSASAESNKLVLTLDEPVLAGETISVEYVPGTLRTSAGIEISWFVFEAENNSEYEPSSLVSGNSQTFSVYPTIVTDLLHIRNEEGNQIKAIEIVDLSGRRVENLGIELNSSQIDLNLSHLQQGVYFLILKDSGNMTSVSRIIKN